MRYAHLLAVAALAGCSHQSGLATAATEHACLDSATHHAQALRIEPQPAGFEFNPHVCELTRYVDVKSQRRAGMRLRPG